MEVVAGKPKLVDPAAVDAESALTATLPRSDIEAALQDDAGADLFLEIARIQNGERDDRTVKVAWERSDLEELLGRASGDAVTLTFDPEELERMLEEPDVEAQGLREKVLVITVAAATAAGMAGSASAQLLSDGGGGGPAPAAVSGLVTDNTTAGVPGSVPGFVTDASTGGATAADPAGINVGTDVSTSGQPGAVSGFATDATTSGQPGSVTGITSDTGSERTRTPASPTAGGGSGFTVPDSAIEAALAGGLALLITGAAFVTRTQRRRETTA
jgi:hypothetical protein